MVSDARRRAEEALRRVLANAAAIVRLSWSDGATPSDRANLERIKSAAADIARDHKILRALLASEPAKGEMGAAVGYLARVPAEAPGGEGKTCPGCGGLGWIPAGDEQLGCIDCNGTGHAPAQPSTAIAEAAERLRWQLTPPRTTTPDGWIFLRAEDVDVVLDARGGGE